MGLATFDMFEPSHRPFLIPDLLSPWITLLSGKAKARKSFLAGYMVEGLLMGSPVLGREPAEGDHRVYWAGFDSGWQEEWMNAGTVAHPWLKRGRRQGATTSQLSTAAERVGLPVPNSPVARSRASRS